MLHDDAMQMFESVANRHNRRLIIDDATDYWIDCHLEATDGLLCEINFVWIDDFVNLSTDYFSMEYYVDDVENAAALFLDAANDILDNKVRSLCLYRRNSSAPYKVKLQRHQSGRWKTFYTYMNRWPWGLFPRQEQRFFFVDPPVLSSS